VYYYSPERRTWNRDREVLCLAATPREPQARSATNPSRGPCHTRSSGVLARHPQGSNLSTDLRRVIATARHSCHRGPHAVFLSPRDAAGRFARSRRLRARRHRVGHGGCSLGRDHRALGAAFGLDVAAGRSTGGGAGLRASAAAVVGRPPRGGSCRARRAYRTGSGARRGCLRRPRRGAGRRQR